MECSSSGVFRMCRAPSATSAAQCIGTRSGRFSCTVIVQITRAATRKLAASTTATSLPLPSANIAAPATGPTSRSASRVRDSEAFASTSRSSGSISLSRPLRAAGTTTNEIP